MFADYFSRALMAGIGLALVTGPLGCFVVWRRMAYFGDTMAHSALLGVALSILLSINTTLGVFAVAALVAGALIVLQRQATLESRTSVLTGDLVTGSIKPARVAPEPMESRSKIATDRPRCKSFQPMERPIMPPPTMAASSPNFPRASTSTSQRRM